RALVGGAGGCRDHLLDSTATGLPAPPPGRGWRPLVRVRRAGALATGRAADSRRRALPARRAGRSGALPRRPAGGGRVSCSARNEQEGARPGKSGDRILARIAFAVAPAA